MREKVRRLNLILVTTLLLLALSGCWSSREINEMAFLMGFGIDRADDGRNYLVTAQIANPAAFGDSPDSGSSRGFLNYSAVGEGVRIAVNELSKMVDRELYVGHNQAVVIGWDLAQEDIATALDYFVRVSDGRFVTTLFIAKDTAREVLATEGQMESMPIANLENLVATNQTNGNMPEVNIGDFFCDYLSTKAPTIPIVEIVEGSDGMPELFMSEMAIVRDNAVCSKLSPDQTQALMMIDGSAANSLIHVGAFDGYVTSRIAQTDVNFSPEFSGDSIEKLKVKLELSCIIEESTSDVNLIEEENVIELGLIISDRVKAQMNDTLAHAQSLGADVFGFGEYLHRNHHSKAKHFIDDWDEMFAKLRVEFEIDVKSISTGAVVKTLTSGSNETDDQTKEGNHADSKG